MPDQSPVLALPLIQPAQAQKHITHNEALLVLDALVQLGVESFEAAAPPAEPAPGARYIVGPGATGAWAGQEGAVALWTGDLWRFFAPHAGWRADHVASGTTLRHDGTGWQATGNSGPVDQLGIGGAVPDAVNRLAVQSEAVLLNHDAGGDHRLKINRAAATDTASLLFQTGFSGGAEMGLAGSGDWSVKVSADGAAWTEALAFDASSGLARGAAVQDGPQDTTPERLATVGGSYGPATLIGTVSETDGLPSGAVIERGSDGAGGHYLRLADGSQVCWGTLTAAAQDISTASGGAFTGAALSGSFAAAFALAPTLTVSDRLVEGTADIWTVVSEVTASGFAALPVALTARVQDRMIAYVARGQAPGIDGVSGTAPVIDGVPVVAGTAEEGAVLTVTAAPVTGTPAPLRGWEWLRDGGTIAGADGASYTVTAADTGAMLSVRQTETNALGSASATSAATGPVTGAASGFDPVTLFAGGETGLLLDFSDTSTLFTDLAGTTGVTATTDPIRFVADLSGTGNNLNSQFTTASPTYTEAGGRAGAFFGAGSSERLVRNAGVIGVPAGLSGVNGITVAIAFTSTTQSNVLSINSGGVGSSDDYLNVVGSVGQGNSIRNYSAGLSAANAMVDNSGFSDTTGAPFVVLMEKDGTEGRHWRNGTLVETDSGLSDPWTANFDAAIDLRNAGGTVYAVVVINRVLTATERSNLTDWLKAKAGIA